MSKPSLCASFAAAALLAVSPAAAQHPFEGAYRVVDVRPAAGHAVEDRTVQAWMGRSVSFDGAFVAADGTRCDQYAVRTLAHAPGEAARRDLALADLWLPPAGEPGMFEDARIGRVVAVICPDGATYGFLAVDPRVLVFAVEEGQNWAVLERQPTAEELRALQDQLATMGHYTGAVDGLMGPATRAAIRAYLEAYGRSAPGRGVVTQNLLTSAPFSAHD